MKKILLIFTFLFSLTVFAQWEPVTLPTTENLIAISFKDANIGFCIAENGIILKTTDGGVNWVIIQNNPTHNYKHLACVDDKMVIFGTESMPYTRKVFISIDEGVTWTNAVNTIYPYFQHEDIQVMNNEIYYRAIGTSSMNLYKFNNNIPTVIAENVYLFGVTESTNEILYFGKVGNTNTLFKSADSGATWLQLTGFPLGLGPDQTFLAKMSSFNNTILIHYTYNPNVAYSLDNGATWTITGDDNPLSVTAILNSTTMYGLQSNNKLYTNTNYLNWVEQTQLVSGVSLKSIYFKSSTLGFVIGNNGTMYRTVNGGLSVIDHVLLEKSIKVYPVPAKDRVQIEIPLDLKIIALDLYDTNGRLLKSLKNTDRSLQTSNLSSGIYLLKINTERGIISKKIIVE